MQDQSHLDAGAKDTHLLDEYKLAVQIQQHYHDMASKTATIYLAATALGLGFVFRENVAVKLKIIFCFFNLGISIFFVLAFLGCLVVSRRTARRMDALAGNLSFDLGTHHALSYSIVQTLLGSTGVLTFWLVVVLARLWTLVPTQAAGEASLLVLIGLS